MKGRIIVTCTNAANRRNINLTFKINAPFRSCTSKFYSQFIDNAENLDVVMPIYDLLEYSDNYSMTSGSLWNYYRDEVNDPANENNDASNFWTNSNKYRTKLIGSTPNQTLKLLFQ